MAFQQFYRLFWEPARAKRKSAKTKSREIYVCPKKKGWIYLVVFFFRVDEKYLAIAISPKNGKWVVLLLFFPMALNVDKVKYITINTTNLCLCLYLMTFASNLFRETCDKKKTKLNFFLLYSIHLFIWVCFAILWCKTKSTKENQNERKEMEEMAKKKKLKRQLDLPFCQPSATDMIVNEVVLDCKIGEHKKKDVF